MWQQLETVTQRSGDRRGRPLLLRSVAGVLAVVTACGGNDTTQSTAAPATAATSASVPRSTTTAVTPTTSPATSSSTSTSTSTTSTSEVTTTTVPAALTCQAYVEQLGDLLLATADQLLAGADVTGELVAGTLSESEASDSLAALSTAFAELSERLVELGAPPDQALAAAEYLGQGLERFESAYDLQSQGAALGDQALIDQGTAELDAGAALLGQITDAPPDCAAPPDPGTALATPDEFDLTVFFRLADSLLASTAYAGTAPEVLTESAQAACRVLLAGDDIRSAIEASIEASPLAGQPFGGHEQSFVLLVVTRGVELWCPGVIGDEEAFRSEVTSTIVDVFFDS